MSLSGMAGGGESTSRSVDYTINIPDMGDIAALKAEVMDLYGAAQKAKQVLASLHGQRQAYSSAKAAGTNTKGMSNPNQRTMSQATQNVTNAQKSYNASIKQMVSALDAAGKLQKGNLQILQQTVTLQRELNKLEDQQTRNRQQEEQGRSGPGRRAPQGKDLFHSGFVEYAANQAAYTAGASTGIPGAGIATAGIGSVLSNVAGALPIQVKAVIAGAIVALGLALAKKTADAIETQQDYSIGSSVALGSGEQQRTLTEGVQRAGQDFFVPIEDNAKYARTLGNAGVGAHALPQALSLAYSASTLSGMDQASSVAMVGDIYAKQGYNIESAAHALQKYAAAAYAANVPMQRMYTMLTELEGKNATLSVNEGQLASLQGMLGLGFDPAKMMGGLMSSSGFNNLAMAGMLGMDEHGFRQLQHQPTKLFDRVGDFVRGASGGNVSIAEGLLGQFGMTDGQTPDQQAYLANLVLTRPGAATAYYNSHVRAHAVDNVTNAATYIKHAQVSRQHQVTPLDQFTTSAPYVALHGIEHPPLPGRIGVPLPTPQDMEKAAAGVGRALDGLGTNVHTVATTLHDMNPVYATAGDSVSSLGSAAHEAARQLGLLLYGVDINGKTPQQLYPNGSLIGGLAASLGKDTTAHKDSFTDALGTTLLGDTAETAAALKKVLPRAAQPYIGDILSASLETGVPVATIAAQLSRESGFDKNAYNKKSGATGIAQFLPGTATQYNVDPTDPHASIRGLARYDRDLQKMFGGSLHNALVAYNEGPGAFHRYGAYKDATAYADSVQQNADTIKHQVAVDIQVHDHRVNHTATVSPAPSSTRGGPGQRMLDGTVSPAWRNALARAHGRG